MTAASTAIVIGGGIAGPVTATALRQAEITATVYEAYPAPSEGIGGDLAIAANGVRALGVIGAADALRAAALPITGQIMSVNGKGLGLLPALDGVEPMQMIGRGDLHRILHDRARPTRGRAASGSRRSPSAAPAPTAPRPPARSPAGSCRPSCPSSSRS